MLVYKPKQAFIYIEMTDKKFNPTSQCHQTTILHIMF